MSRARVLETLQGIKEIQSHAHCLIIAALERLDDGNDPITVAVLQGASDALASLEPVLSVIRHLEEEGAQS